MAGFLYTLIIHPLYTLIECIYTLFNAFFDIEGLAIIVVSVAVTVLCLPLYAVAEHWQEVERLKQESMKAQLSRIKRAFKGDERYMMTTAYYRECGYSPIMALRSSFGLLIQIPFFIAAYHFLSGLPMIRGKSFLFIRDLGAPDALFSIGSFTVNVLPIAMTLINCASGAVYSKGHGAREKVQIFGMAAIFLVLLYNSPAGLVLYWTFNNIFSLIKNIFYKMKNPLKDFYTCVLAVMTAMAFYIIFIYRTAAAYKAAALFVIALIVFTPLFLKRIGALLDGPLSALVNDARLRNTIFILSCLILFVLSGYTIPSTLISSSPTEFANIGGHGSPMFYIWNCLLQSAGLNIFWAFCVYFLFGARVQTGTALFMNFIALAALVDAYIFMLPYGDISATLRFLNMTSFHSISLKSLLNIIVLAAVALCTLGLAAKNRTRILTGLSTIILITVSAVCLLNTNTINREYKEYIESRKSSGEEMTPILHLSKNHPNVLLFMLDRAQSPLVPEMVKEDPELAKIYSGWTLYENTLAYNGHTYQGAGALFGGYDYTPLSINKQSDVPTIEKVNRSQLLLPRIFSEELGYKANVIDPTWINGEQFCDLSFLEPYPQIEGHQAQEVYTTLWYKNKNKYGLTDASGPILKRNLFMFSVFREAPIFLRELIYKDDYWYSNEAVTDTALLISRYAPLDFLIELTDIKETENGTYTSVVNELTHGSEFLQAPDYVPVPEVTQFSANEKMKRDQSYYTQMAAFKRIGEWLQFLKDNGVYDNTRIIFVSDHGNYGIEPYFESNPALDKKVHGTKYEGRGHYHALLMFKDFNATGPLKIDDSSFMTNADSPSLLLNGLLENPKDPFTGKDIPLDTAPLKKDGVVISASDRHQPGYNKSKYIFNVEDSEWWLVKDPIKSSSSWSQIDLSNEYDHNK